MSSEPEGFGLGELSARAGVTPRTVRYYIQQGLLRSPGTPGPGARYDQGHLDRLKLIRRLQREHLPLSEIRRRLESLADAEVHRLLQQPEPPVRSSAVDYVRGVLREPPALFTAAMAASPEPPPGADRSQWDRLTLAPDLELHVRRPLSRAQNRIVEKLLAYARRLLEEDTP
ncbi:MAG TPA: MerR family transcriptional regulator [Gemmatimonadales bacterium]|nr:MerR family transcriptional regulator [Gemmatimonadales bacterium]